MSLIQFPVRAFLSIQRSVPKDARQALCDKLESLGATDWEVDERTTRYVFSFVVADIPTYERLEAAAIEDGSGTFGLADPKTPEEQLGN